MQRDTRQHLLESEGIGRFGVPRASTLNGYRLSAVTHLPRHAR